MYYDATQALKCFHVGAMIWQQPWEVKTDGMVPILLARNWGSKRFWDLPKVTQLGNTKLRAWILQLQPLSSIHPQSRNISLFTINFQNYANYMQIRTSMN